MAPITQPQTFAEITPEMIQDWKAKYGQHSLRHIHVPALTEITINAAGEAEEEVLTPAADFVARTPSRATMDLITKHSIDKDPIATNKALIAGSVLGGDMEQMEGNASVYVSLVEQLQVLLRASVASLKKI